MFALVILLVLIGACWAHTPNYLALSCNAQSTALQWLNAALDGKLLITQTLFGGLDCNGVLIDACYEDAAKLDDDTCILPENPTCFDGCNLGEQIVVDDECCQDEFDPAYMDGDAVCRTNRKWLSIADDKLYQAMEEYEKDTEEGYALAIELACAAEKIYTAVLTSFGSAFLALDATYRHIFSPQNRVKFFDNEPALSTLVRTVQSFRDCTQPGVCRNHTLIATFSLFRTDKDGPLSVGINQLLWPIGGTMSAFDKTFLPSSQHCAAIHEPTAVSPATQVAFRMPTLGPLDYARVVQAFSRCSGFPVSGCVQGYHDLAINRCCNTLTLIKDLAAAVDVLPESESVPRIYSFVYVAHLHSSITYESDTTRDVHVEADLFLRLAAADSCLDREVSTVTPASVQLQIEPHALLSMAPGESRCVGGSHAGKTCTARNQCGAGLACTIRPGTKKSFCFDGTWWNSAMPCTLDSQCPYGECYGAVSGDSGGIYPFLHIWKENSCDDPTLATPVCNDPRVQKWFDNPQNKAKRV